MKHFALAILFVVGTLCYGARPAQADGTCWTIGTPYPFTNHGTPGIITSPYCGTNGALNVNVITGGGSTGAITSPLGSKPSANSVSVTISPDSAAQTFVAAAPIPVAYNSSAGYVPPVACGKSLSVSLSGAGTSQLVALSGTTQVYVCGLALSIAGASATFQLEYGTGTACGTGTTTLTGVFPISFLQFGNGLGAVTHAPAGTALCALTTGTAAVQGLITYDQF